MILRWKKIEIEAKAFGIQEPNFELTVATVTHITLKLEGFARPSREN